MGAFGDGPKSRAHLRLQPSNSHPSSPLPNVTAMKSASEATQLHLNLVLGRTFAEERRAREP